MYRVLVADDEPIEREVVSRAIRKYFPEQLSVTTAVNGNEAVEKFAGGQYQIVILDIAMPGINGLEAAENIRQINKNCSIIFLTAFDEFTYAKRAISVHALDYLLKPWTDEELVAVLEEAVRIAMERESGDKDRKKTDFKECNRQEDSQGNIRMNAVVEAICDYIESHYMEDISLQEAADAMNYSEAYFCKIFKQCFGKSFVMYLSEFRMEKAKQLLADALINVKDVSMKVGYGDSNYFAKVFKRIVGVTPTEYRIRVLRLADRDEN